MGPRRRWLAARILAALAGPSTGMALMAPRLARTRFASAGLVQDRCGLASLQGATSGCAAPRLLRVAPPTAPPKSAGYRGRETVRCSALGSIASGAAQLAVGTAELAALPFRAGIEACFAVAKAAVVITLARAVLRVLGSATKINRQSLEYPVYLLGFNEAVSMDDWLLPNTRDVPLIREREKALGLVQALRGVARFERPRLLGFKPPRSLVERPFVVIQVDAFGDWSSVGFLCTLEGQQIPEEEDQAKETGSKAEGKAEGKEASQDQATPEGTPEGRGFTLSSMGLGAGATAAAAASGVGAEKLVAGFEVLPAEVATRIDGRVLVRVHGRVAVDKAIPSQVPPGRSSVLDRAVVSPMADALRSDRGRKFLLWPLAPGDNERLDEQSRLERAGAKVAELLREESVLKRLERGDPENINRAFKAPLGGGQQAGALAPSSSSAALGRVDSAEASAALVAEAVSEAQLAATASLLEASARLDDASRVVMTRGENAVMEDALESAWGDEANQDAKKKKKEEEEEEEPPAGRGETAHRKAVCPRRPPELSAVAAVAAAATKGSRGWWCGCSWCPSKPARARRG
mmetsp:Transcript_49164/g.111511  ORF Transcript_49164/g.111511 Transcript_49164/m.111511 type:complete len:578 (-) Transcript_49164:713-2446(-)